MEGMEVAVQSEVLVLQVERLDPMVKLVVSLCLPETYVLIPLLKRRLEAFLCCGR